MSGLEKLAQGPIGATLGGFLEGEIEENRLEKILEQKKDDEKAGLVTYASERIIDNYAKIMGTSNEKYDAIEALKSQGLPLYFIHEMDRNGMFNQDNPNNALNTAQELWGHQFWRDETNPYYKKYTQISGQYENIDEKIPAISEKYKTKSGFAMNQINNILENGLGMGGDTIKYLTQPTTAAPGETVTAAPGETVTAAQTSDSIPSLGIIKAPTTVDVEETQMRMAINPDYLIRLGYTVDKTAHMTPEGDFNWAAFQSDNPESLAAVTLLRNSIATPYAELANGTAYNVGLGHMNLKHVTAGKINEMALADTIGLITSQAINGERDFSEKELVINALKTKNPGQIPYTTDNLIRLLDRSNPNWLQSYKDLGVDVDVSGIKNVVATNPFAGTPLSFLIEEKETKKGEKVLSFDSRPIITADDYKNWGDNYLNGTMFNPRNPLTYFQIRDIHSKHYGNQATLTIESGRMVDSDPVFGGTGRSELATPGGATSEEMMLSAKYLIPSTIKYKKEKANIDYTPIKGMTETTSVLLDGTSMGTVEQIESTLEDFAGDVIGLEGYVTNLLLEQQQAGLLPQALTVTDMEMLKDSILDDIFEMEYEIKVPEDKADIDTEVDTEVIVPSVEESIITDTVEDFPVDTEIETVKTKSQLEREERLKREQIERDKKMEKILDKATKVQEDVATWMESESGKSFEQKKELAKEREKKVIDFFKNLLPGGD